MINERRRTSGAWPFMAVRHGQYKKLTKRTYLHLKWGAIEGFIKLIR